MFPTNLKVNHGMTVARPTEIGQSTRSVRIVYIHKIQISQFGVSGVKGTIQNREPLPNEPVTKKTRDRIPYFPCQTTRIYRGDLCFWKPQRRRRKSWPYMGRCDITNIYIESMGDNNIG